MQMSSDAVVPGSRLWGKTAAPGRVLPGAFAIFGGVAGLFAIFAAGAFRDAARDVSPLAPALATLIVGALAGVFLGRFAWSADRELPAEVTAIRVGGVSVAAGAVSGGLVGGLTWGAAGVLRFALGGALVGALFFPGCLAVFRASVRSARARHGSLVASADARTVVSTLLAGGALLAATQVPALLQVSPSVHLHPLVQAGASLLVCLGATGAIIALRRRDARDRKALESAIEGDAFFEKVDDPRSIAADAVDLGIGDDHFASSGAQGYRSAASEVKLRGSVAAARSAFQECERSRYYALLLATFALVEVAGAIVLRISEMQGGLP